MLRSSRDAGLAALVCLVGLALTGLAAFAFPLIHVRDEATLRGFGVLDRPRLGALLDDVAHLADPLPYALAAVAFVLVALARRRRDTALIIPVIMVGAGLSAELLKGLLAHPRTSEWLGTGQIAAASWPSGHSTAAMAMALCAVLAAPPRLRPAVGALGGCFAVAVAYAILALRWHFPSDVIGGYLVALTWTLAGVTVVLAHRERSGTVLRDERAPNTAERRIPLWIGAVLALAGALAVALRPERIGDYAAAHPTFVVGAGFIAIVAGVFAVGFARAVGSRG